MNKTSYLPNDCFEFFCKYLYKYEQLEDTVNKSTAKDQTLKDITPELTETQSNLLPAKTSFTTKEIPKSDNKGRKEWSDELQRRINDNVDFTDHVYMIKDYSTIFWSFLTYIRHAIAHAGIYEDPNNNQELTLTVKDIHKKNFRAYGKISKEKFKMILAAFTNERSVVKSTFLTSLFILLFVGATFLSCSSNEGNEENVKHELQEKKLKRVFTTENGQLCMEESYFYDSHNRISDIHCSHYEGSTYVTSTVVSLLYHQDSIVIFSQVTGQDGTEVAYLRNGRIQKVNHLLLNYNEEGRLVEVIESDTSGNEYYFRKHLITWDNNDIKEYCCYTNDYEYRIEYTYTDHNAGMLSYFLNPLGEYDFLDCIEEQAFMWTGACGQLSMHLPKSAIYYELHYNYYFSKYLGTYEYEFDKSGYPIKVKFNMVPVYSPSEYDKDKNSTCTVEN